MTASMQPSPELRLQSHQTFNKGSLSFSLAARLFSEELRTSASLLYLWCRHCDDEIDKAHSGPLVLERLERDTRKALLFSNEARLAPAFEGLAVVARPYSIPSRFPLDLLEGMRMDLEQKYYVTLSELRRYCYCVAGTVGLMMTYIMGASSARALPHAVELGIAMQLTNIARDVREDLGLGRVYLPSRWLEEAGVERSSLTPESLEEPALRAKVFKVTARLLEAAEASYDSALEGLRYLPLRSAFAIVAASAIYREIGREVIRRGPEALLQRTVISLPRKLICAARAVLTCIPIVIRRLFSRWKRTALPTDWEFT